MAGRQRGRPRSLNVARRYTPTNAVCGRKHCTICGRWRHASDFNADRAERDNGFRLHPSCRPCRQAYEAARRERERNAQWRGPYQEVVDKGDGIDAGPFLRWLDDWRGYRAVHRSQLGQRNDRNRPLATEEEICKLAGVSVRALGRARTEGRISWVLVDRMLTVVGANQTLPEMYPELYPDLELDSWCEECRTVVAPFCGVCPLCDGPVSKWQEPEEMAA